MRDFLSGPKAFATVAMLAAVGGCGSFSDVGSVGSVNLLPQVSNLSRPDWLTYSGAKDEFSLRPVTAADLVSAEGQCAMATAEARRPIPVAPTEPTVPGGIALQMTECDVVRRAGAPEQLQVGADERGDRAVVITYVRGPRPGIYRFSARTADVDRARAGSAAAPRRRRKRKSPKKAARS